MDTDSGIQKKSVNIMNTYLGFILELLLLIVLLIMGTISPLFFSKTNLLNVFYTFVVYALLALGLSLPTYVKRIDLSGAAVLALSAWIFASFAKNQMPVWGFAIAISAGMAVGIVNGLINSLINTPSSVTRLVFSAAVTLGVSLVIVFSLSILMNGQPVFIENAIQNRSITAVLMLITALVAAVLLLFTTKLGKEDNKKLIVISYLGSAAVSALAGYYFVLLHHFAFPSMGTENIIYLVFAAGSILAVRSFKRQMFPIVLALLAAMSWTFLSNLLYLMNAHTYIHTALQCALAAVFFILALLIRRRHKSDSGTC